MGVLGCISIYANGQQMGLFAEYAVCDSIAFTYFLVRQGAHDRGTRFLRRTTLNCPFSGDCPLEEVVVDGGVGAGMLGFFFAVANFE